MPLHYLAKTHDIVNIIRTVTKNRKACMRRSKESLKSLSYRTTKRYELYLDTWSHHTLCSSISKIQHSFDTPMFYLLYHTMFFTHFKKCFYFFTCHPMRVNITMLSTSDQSQKTCKSFNHPIERSEYPHENSVDRSYFEGYRITKTYSENFRRNFTKEKNNHSCG